VPDPTAGAIERAVDGEPSSCRIVKPELKRNRGAGGPLSAAKLNSRQTVKAIHAAPFRTCMRRRSQASVTTEWDLVELCCGMLSNLFI
jgi:hypothetical protein